MNICLSNYDKACLTKRYTVWNFAIKYISISKLATQMVMPKLSVTIIYVSRHALGSHFQFLTLHFRHRY